MPDYDQTRLPDESPAASLLKAGQQFGQYRVVRLLGRGGMGQVYEVEHRVLRIKYALKVINEELLNRSDVTQRFEREAQVMARLQHSHIVHVDDFGVTDGLTWLRMELVPGNGDCCSLADFFSKGPVHETEVAHLLSQILNGLGFAHEQGAVHRDLKPANLLFDAQGNLKIADFGLVSLAGADWLQSQVQLTVARSMVDSDATLLEGNSSNGSRTKALLGTYAYMSPEQKKGQEVTTQSDLYSVGLMAFQLLTGEETLGFEMPSEIIEELSEDWDFWVKRALAPRMERRFLSALEMINALPDVAIKGSVTNAGAVADAVKENSIEAVERAAAGLLNQASAIVTPDIVDSPAFSISKDTKGYKLVELPNGGKYPLVEIHPGTFQMGSPLSEDERDDDELLHSVTISRRFWLGATVVTQAQWESLMGSNPSRFKGADLPIEQVSWEDAMIFCRKLTAVELKSGCLPDGYEYTLPSEAEWEYACRAGTSATYSGDLDSIAWYLDNSERRTHRVAQKSANAWGLYDMHGNVYEWCSDWFDAYSSGSALDPVGASSGRGRVHRGGSWDYSARYCRSAFRYHLRPENNGNNVGFRIALKFAR